ncbi:hypothetical protein PybrP1_002497 [[Pythium] brassicae (nom. inval.)]|nr:hypothetical protein PybrP1_002497 [[Pythium] brassicae (nom. inval.)]
MANVVARVTPQKLESDAWQRWIDGLDAFLFDCDGVLWRGDAGIPGAREAIELLRSLGKRVVFVTNNSTKSRETYVKVLTSHGIPVVAEEIVNSAWATVAYMKKENISGKVYFVGEAGLGQELEKEGYEAFGLEHGDLKTLPSPNFSYYKLAYATVCVRQNPGCRFIGTNPDSTFPVDGAILPGGGTLVKTIECAVGHPPEAVIGKPSQDLLKTILSTYNLDPARTCMVGDRLSTDIAFGRLGGLQTLLVLTGVTHEPELGSIELPEYTPHHYIQSVKALSELHQLATHS